MPSITTAFRPLIARVLSTRGPSQTRTSTAVWAVAVLALAGLVSRTATAQVVPGAGAQIGSLAADHARLSQVMGDSAPSLAREPVCSQVCRIAPTVLLIWNSDIPTGGNERGLLAGRGLNASLSGGVQVKRTFRTLRTEVTLAPEFQYSENLPFQFLPGSDTGRSRFSSPWHTGRNSVDLPLRFGDQSLRILSLGQSGVSIATHAVAFGATAANEWWGPALRNTLVLSNNAAGIPRLFVRTAHPLLTGIGTFDARMFVGGLTESLFFDRDPGNDARSASGMLATFRPAGDSGLTFGLSRLVIAPVGSNGAVIGHAVDVLSKWEPIYAADDTSSTGIPRQRSDQIFSLFSRWVFPASGAEVYGEWARMELPRSLREFLIAPQSTQAYTIGGQVARAAGAGRVFRMQAEATYLEQNLIWVDRPVVDYYSGRAAVQGFTERGHVLGASIGPGSSSQYVAADWMTHEWSAGAFASRTRTEEDALLRQPGAKATRHDVTLLAGARGAYHYRVADVSFEIASSWRLNYLFQSQYYIGVYPIRATDISNLTLTLRVDPR